MNIQKNQIDDLNLQVTLEIAAEDYAAIEQKTLNDKAIDAVMQKIIQNLKKQLNAELR